MIVKKDLSESKTNKPELENIPLEKFVARWKGHEVLSQEPILIEEKSKAVFEIDNKQLDVLSKKGLSPRFYKWNEEKEKWVALATKIDKDKIETYENVEGYIASFGVKQPTFEDIKGTEWYAKQIDRANGLAIIEGYTDERSNKRLKPHNTISRSEFYTIVARLFGAVKEGEASLYEEFDYINDHGGVDWYIPYLEEFKDKGVIDAVFNREQARENITRLEVVELLTKMIERVEDVDYINYINLNDFKDVQGLEGIMVANIIDGYEDKTLRLDNKITRAEALTLIINVLESLGW